MSGSGSRSGRSWLLVIALIALVGAFTLFRNEDSSRPYRLDDAGDMGYKGLRLVLEGLGARVEGIDADEIVATLGRPDTVVLLPVGDGVNAPAASQFRRAVRDGGRLVVGSPFGEDGLKIGGGPMSGYIVGTPVGACDIDGLEGLDTIDPAGSAPLIVPAGATSCFGTDREGLVVREVLGNGTLTTLASPNLFANGAMRPHNQEVDQVKTPMRDNVVVAARLLDARRGVTVAIVTSGTATASFGSESLTDMLGSGVKLGLWQFIAAFAFYAWWRGRRHGRVVPERLPVEIAGSELVDAVGNLMSRRGDPAHAAMLLRTAAVRELAERLGVPRATDVTIVAGLVAQRLGTETATVLHPLAAAEVTSDADLVAIAAQLETIRTEVLHGRSARPALGARSDPGVT